MKTSFVRRHLYSLVGTLFIASSAHAAGPVAVVTNPQGSLGYSIAAAVAKVAGDVTGTEVRAVGQSGSTVFLPQVARNEMAFGTSNTFEVVFATQGKDQFEGRPNPNLRVAAMLVPFSVGFMVPADSPIQSVADLRGKRIPTGYAKQRLVGVIQDAVLLAGKVDKADIEPVLVANFVEATSLLQQGRVDAVLLAPGSGLVKKVQADMPVRFIDLTGDPAIAKSIGESLPGATLALVKPSDRLPEITAPTHLVGYQYALVTNKAVPDQQVYDIVKALHGNKAALAKGHGIFNSFNPADMAPRLEGASYHPGAIRFWQEAGLWPAK